MRDQKEREELERKICCKDCKGRLQLIKSVLSSLHTFWGSAFLLPAKVVSDIEMKMRNFLWTGKGDKKGMAKVAWKAICVPKHEGGLGIRRIGDMNKALMVTHVWSILTNRDSLWVKWVRMHRVGDRNFWTIPVPTLCTWSWRNILKVRDDVKGRFRVSIGDGKSTNAWFDYWCEASPLSSFITPRLMTNGGYNLHSTVHDVLMGGWPPEWVDRFPALRGTEGQIPIPNRRDIIWWEHESGLVPFSTSLAWDTIRFRAAGVDWLNTVWFPQCIPKHAFMMWLVMRRKLPTQDRLLKWRTDMNLLCCSLCKTNYDSHIHLFFECCYAKQIWDSLCLKTSSIPRSTSYLEIVQAVGRSMKPRSITSITDRLILAATIYEIWIERNRRMFNENPRPPETVVQSICQMVRYRLMGVKVKQTANVRSLFKAWDIHQDWMREEG